MNRTFILVLLILASMSGTAMANKKIRLDQLIDYSLNPKDLLGMEIIYTQEESIKYGIASVRKNHYQLERFAYQDHIYLFLMTVNDRTIIDCIIRKKLCSNHFFGHSELSLDDGEFIYYLVEFTACNSDETLKYIEIMTIDENKGCFVGINYEKLAERPALYR